MRKKWGRRKNIRYLLLCFPAAFSTRLLLFNVIAFNRAIDQLSVDKCFGNSGKLGKIFSAPGFPQLHGAFD